MRKEIVLTERMNLLEKEISTVAERSEEIAKDLKELKSLRTEMRGLKLYLGRIHPEFKREFAEILKKCD